MQIEYSILMLACNFLYVCAPLRGTVHRVLTPVDRTLARCESEKTQHAWCALHFVTFAFGSHVRPFLYPRRVE